MDAARNIRLVDHPAGVENILARRGSKMETVPVGASLLSWRSWMSGILFVLHSSALVDVLDNGRAREPGASRCWVWGKSVR